MAEKLNWTEIWRKFDDEFSAAREKELCRSCKRIHFEEPDWDAQKKIIERIVNRRIANQTKKK